MTILRDISVAAHLAPRFSAAEIAGIAASGGRAPIAALDFETKAWRVAGRTVAAPLSGARYDFSALNGGTRGLLLEPARTNVVFPSALGPTGWTTNGGATISTATGAAFGGLSGALVTSGTSDWGRAYSNSFALNAGTTYAVTVWLKAGSSGKARIEIYGTGLDLIVAGTVGALAINYQSGGTIAGLEQTDVGGIWRVRFRITPTASAGNVTLGIGAFTGTAGQTVIAYAAQLEQGSGATSYIATTTAAVTRAVDAPEWALGGWFNAAQGAVEIALTPQALSIQTLLQVVTAGGSVLATLGYDAAGGVSATVAGVGLVHPTALVAQQPQSLRLAWGPGGTKLKIGTTTVSGAAAALDGAAKLRFGPANALGRTLYLYDRAL